MSACVEQFARARDAADASSNLTGKPPAYPANQPVVVAFRLGRVEVDELYALRPGETPDPCVDVARRERQVLALNELHDPAALEIDGWNQHRKSDPHGNATAAQIFLEIGNRVLGVMKNGCGQRRISQAVREHVEKVLESTGSSRCNHRDVDGA